jgi:hypothetical protein
LIKETGRESGEIEKKANMCTNRSIEEEKERKVSKKEREKRNEGNRRKIKNQKKTQAKRVTEEKEKMCVQTI